MTTDHIKRIPEIGRSWNSLRQELLDLKSCDFDWRRGRLPLYVYHESDELAEISKEAYCLFFTENALGSRAFPSVARMERDIIEMALSLFHAPVDADGSFTSGGTESIFLALKTARDQARAAGRVEEPYNVVAPKSAHATLDKAAHYLGMSVVRVPLGANYRAELRDVDCAINHRTIMVVASAPGYPHGVYDQISDLAGLAESRALWLHVDACFGGFLAPFARDEGFPIPPFDFELSGVTSLSADLHKYGLSAKGASVLLLKEHQLKQFQGFRFDNWPRGSYSTETFLGSRSAGVVASAWAVLQHMGKAGYRRQARTIMETKARFVQGIESIEGLKVIEPSELSILLYHSVDDRVHINAVADNMVRKGWFMGRCAAPPALHMALNAVHATVVDAYVDDLRDAVERARVSGDVGSNDDRTY